MLVKNNLDYQYIIIEKTLRISSPYFLPTRMSDLRVGFVSFVHKSDIPVLKLANPPPGAKLTPDRYHVVTAVSKHLD